MLNLELFTGTRWIDLAPGVRVEVLPMGMTVMTDAFADPALPAPDGEGKRQVPVPLILRAVARRAIVGWEGIGDAAGRPVKVTPEGVTALLEHPACHQAFLDLYYNPGMAVIAEGNASSPSRSGSSRAAQTTARAAKASAKSARPASTNRKRAKAGRSGS